MPLRPEPLATELAARGFSRKEQPCQRQQQQPLVLGSECLGQTCPKQIIVFYVCSHIALSQESFLFLPFSCSLRLREETPSVWTRHHLTLFPTVHGPRTGSTQLSEGSQPAGTCSGGRLIFPRVSGDVWNRSCRLGVASGRHE